MTFLRSITELKFQGKPHPEIWRDRCIQRDTTEATGAVRVGPLNLTSNCDELLEAECGLV